MKSDGAHGSAPKDQTMTTAKIKQAFRQMNSTDQAVLLKELSAALAEAMTEMDHQDNAIFAARRHAESKARPWRDVVARLNGSRRRRK
jgi:hypothetical protein